MGKTAKKAAQPQTDTTAMATAMMAVSPATTKAWLDVMSESSRFVMDRLQQDLETQRAMLACKSPTDLMRLQAEFFQTAMQQYSEESMRLFKMMSDATEKTVAEAGTSRSRGYDDVPL